MRNSWRRAAPTGCWSRNRSSSRPERGSKDSRLLLLMAALSVAGRRPSNRRLLATLPGLPRGILNGMRALRRDLRDLSEAGLLAPRVDEQEREILGILGPLAQRSRRFPFRNSILQAWKRRGQDGGDS